MSSTGEAAGGGGGRKRRKGLEGQKVGGVESSSGRQEETSELRHKAAGSSRTTASASASGGTRGRLYSVGAEKPNGYGEVHVLIVGDDGVGKRTLAKALVGLETAAQLPVKLKISLRNSLVPDNDGISTSIDGSGSSGSGSSGSGAGKKMERRRTDVGRVDFIVLMTSMTSKASWDAALSNARAPVSFEYRFGRAVLVATHTDLKRDYALRKSDMSGVREITMIPILQACLTDDESRAALCLNIFQRILTALGSVGSSTGPLLHAMAKPSSLILPGTNEFWLEFEPESALPPLPKTNDAPA